MKFRDYLEHLKGMVNKNPHILDFEVVYSRDDEGNGYQKVSYTACSGFYDPENQEFTPTKSVYEPSQSENLEFVVCIN